MDIRSFFTSIDQSILYSLISKKIKSDEIRWLSKTIIFHDCARDIQPRIQSQPSLFSKLPSEKSLFQVRKGKGLPIGNLTSQFFANVYLNELDQFAKRDLRIKYYIRYVDDFIILERDLNKLEFYQKEISLFLENKLALTAHPKKQIIRPLQNGIDFVGYFLKPDYTLVRRRVVFDWNRKIREFSDKCDPERRNEIFYSYASHASWANARTLSENQGRKIKHTS
jgi:hypothetical protein